MKKTLILLLWAAGLLHGTERTAAQSKITWQLCFGGTSSELVSSVIRSSDGNFVVAGTTASTDGNVPICGANPTPQTNDVFVAKIDRRGNVLWEQCYGSSGHNEVSQIIQTSDGGYCFVGSTDSNIRSLGVLYNGGGLDVWLVKLDAKGELQWQHCYGGSDVDRGASVTQQSNGRLLVAANVASTDGQVIGNHGSQDIWLFEPGIENAIDWQHCYGGKNWEVASKLLPTPDGGIVLIGSTGSAGPGVADGDISSNHGQADMWIARLGANLKIVWERCYGGASIDEANSACMTDHGGLAVIGTTSSSDGDIKDALGGEDAVLLQLDSLGSIEWERCIGGFGNDEGSDLARDPQGDFFLAMHTLSADGNLEGRSPNGSIRWDVFVAKVSASGEYRWGNWYGGSMDDHSTTIAVADNTTFVVAGETNSKDGDVVGLHTSNDGWVFAVTDTISLSAPRVADPEIAYVVDNPIRTSLSVRFASTSNSPILAELSTELGAVVMTTQFTPLPDGRPVRIFDVRQIPRGVYLLRLSMAGWVRTAKVVVIPATD